MQYLREIAKIAEWGVRGNRARVEAYVNQLIEKARQHGDERAADRLGQVFKFTENNVTPSGLSEQCVLPVHDQKLL